MRLIAPVRTLTSVALLATAFLSHAAWAKGAGPKLVTTVEGVSEYALSNGLKVLLFPEPSKPTITVNITYLVGSRFEGYGETGMAHLLEHMVFKGSPRHKNIPVELTSHGARPNGTTSNDRTNYFETFSATDENLKWALDLEADRMVHSFIAKKDLDTEMTVVRNEYERGENNPERVLNERTLSTAYLWHNYGNSTIGARADIENVPIERLQAFYRRYYQPDNAVLTVAGRFDAAKTLALIDKTFSVLPRPTRVLDRTYTREPTQDGERSVTLRRSGDVQVVSTAYHVPSGSHPDAAPIDILTEVLDSAPSGRLYKALVETKKAATVSAEFYALNEPGVIYAQASVRQSGALDEARQGLLDTIDAVVAHPPTQEEIDRARGSLLKNIDLTLTNTERVGLSLSEWIALGDWRLFYLHRDRLKKVTPEDVQRVAAAYLKPSNRTVGLFIPTTQPDRAIIPESPAIETLVAGYKGDPDIALGEAFDPSPANIEARTTRSKLANGLSLALLPKKTRGAIVALAGTLRFGDEKSLAGKSMVPGITAAMLTTGTTKHTRQQIRDEFDRLKARVSIGSGGSDKVRVNIETVRENFPAVLALVTEILRTPSFLPAELDRLRQEVLADLEHRKSDPDALAQNALSRHLSPYAKGDPRYTATIEEQISEMTSITTAQLVQFHKDFYGASDAQVAVVGDFDPAATTTQLGELLGDWKSPKPFTRIPSVYFEIPGKTVTLQTPDKENATFLAGQNLQIRDDDAEYPAMILGNMMLGGGFLNSRLAVRIRQKEGLSYGVNASFYSSPFDKVGGFNAMAIYAPQNVDRLTTAFDEEITRALKDGFTAQEIAEAKSGYLQSRQVQRAQDASLARTLADDLFIDRNLLWDAKYEARVKTLTPEDVHTAMQHHMALEKFSKVKAGDFARLPPKGATTPAAATKQ